MTRTAAPAPRRRDGDERVAPLSVASRARPVRHPLRTEPIHGHHPVAPRSTCEYRFRGDPDDPEPAATVGPIPAADRSTSIRSSRRVGASIGRIHGVPARPRTEAGERAGPGRTGDRRVPTGARPTPSGCG